MQRAEPHLGSAVPGATDDGGHRVRGEVILDGVAQVEVESAKCVCKAVHHKVLKRVSLRRIFLSISNGEPNSNFVHKVGQPGDVNLAPPRLDLIE
jgi:hypothetical protein